VGQLTADLQRHRAVSAGSGRRWLEAESTSGALARGLDAYRDQLDGLSRPPAAGGAHQAALRRPSPSRVGQQVPGPDDGPSP
jgi:hypothetical protein